MAVKTLFSQVKITGFPNRPRIEFHLTNRKTLKRHRVTLTTGQQFGMPPKRGLKDQQLLEYMEILRRKVEDNLIEGWRPGEEAEKVVEEKKIYPHNRRFENWMGTFN